ncbi:MAG: Uncharacterized protein XD63_0970 [Thermoanaerobacterales bacterium 50_218]|nr:MAG: Uncharacterized protein XD63_0970 [Thermoanaerobacterales bacterium 50_218]
MIDEILSFIERHQESYATRSICRQLIGDYPEKMTSETLYWLKKSLEKADHQEIEGYYYLVM